MIEAPEAIAQRVKSEIKTNPVLRPNVQPVLPVSPVKPKEEDKRNKLVEEEELQNDRRRQYVSGIFKSLYYTYTNICSPIPHVAVENRICEDWFGYSLTRIDTLDALWLFKMKTEFFDSMRWVESHFDASVPKVVSVSDATNRLLGGLLSAFEVSDQPIFLKKASQLADRLMPAFEGHTHGLPLPHIHLQTGARSNGDDESKETIFLGDVGSLQLEFSYLAHHLYEPKYAQKALKIFQRLRLHPMNDEPGLYASTLSLSTGKAQNHLYTLNYPSDSFFKNVFKLYRLFYKRVKWVNEMWTDIVGGIMKHLATTSGPFTFPKEVNFGTTQGGKNNQQGQTGELAVGHSSCALAGLLALYAQDISGETEKSSIILSFSNAFVDTCVAMNSVSPTGIASEFTRLVDGKLVPVIDDQIKLRADTFEALFYMFRMTGDPKHRNAAWQLFEAVTQHFQLQLPKSAFSKTSKTAISSLVQPTAKLNATSMRFLTKVLKFLYLTYSDPDEFPINKNVWNSDGHVFSIFKPDITIYS